MFPGSLGFSDVFEEFFCRILLTVKEPHLPRSLAAEGLHLFSSGKTERVDYKPRQEPKEHIGKFDMEKTKIIILLKKKYTILSR